MDSSKEIIDHSAEVIKLLDEVKELGYTDKDLEHFGYTKKYLGEQISKARAGMRNEKLINGLTWLRNQRLQKANQPGFLLGRPDRPFLLEYFRAEAAKLPNQANEERYLLVGDLFKKSQFSFQIADDAMKPVYPRGSYIGLREIPDKIIIPGQVYLLEWDNDVLIRRLYYKDNNQETGIFKLVPDNAGDAAAGSPEESWAYPSFYIDSAIVKGLFKVTWVLISEEILSAEV